MIDVLEFDIVWSGVGEKWRIMAPDNILMNENDEWDRWVSNLLLPNDLRATFIIALQLAAFM